MTHLQNILRVTNNYALFSRSLFGATNLQMRRKSDMTLYYTLESGPCRTVLMTAKILGVDFNLKKLNLINGEQLKSEFLKLNPLHTVPTLTDGDLSLHESRVIITYLIQKYNKNDSLYPVGIKKRAQTDQMLYFDIAVLYRAIYDYYRHIYYGAKTFDEKRLPNIKKAFEALDTFLEKSKYVSGDTMTISDIAITSSVATAIAVFNQDLTPYPNVNKWFKHMKSSLPDYKEIIEENAEKLRLLVESVKAKNNHK